MKLIYFLLLFCMPLITRAQQAGKAGIIILGIAQDGGYPHLGCNKQCCKLAWDDQNRKRYVVALALTDPVHKKWWLLEATPDIKEQLHYFQSLTNGQYNYLPEGIFITHAHIGHYTGLMQLGKEVMGTNNVPVYVLPKMKVYLETNGPWSQLVSQHNIQINSLTAELPVELSPGISIQAFTVPHRDEYSETAGFRIVTPNKHYLFIPDINKWNKWDRDIIKLVDSSDIALLDGTFYNGTELPGRNIKDVPHPFVTETMQLFHNQTQTLNKKVWFIHLNHTNPLLWDKQSRESVIRAGYNLAQQGQKL